MAEKPPSRKVQAPRVRQHERRPTPGDADRRRRMLLYALAGSGLVALAAVLIFVFAGRGESEKEVAAAMQDAGCTYRTNEAQEAKHVQEDTEPKWNTDPPSSGPHFPVAAPFDFYEEPVDLLRLVHNLEHGGIAVLYGDDIDDTTIERIRAWWQDDPNGIVVSPLSRLGDEITLTAWTREGNEELGHIARCTTFDESAFSTFRDELRARGPEPFPLDALEPGT